MTGKTVQEKVRSEFAIFFSVVLDIFKGKNLNNL